jgi:lysozyme
MALLMVVFHTSPVMREMMQWSRVSNACAAYWEWAHTTPYNVRRGVKIPAGYQVHGIDVSHYQFKINWKQVATTDSGGIKILFVFIKATEGKTLSDRYYSYNIREARKNGIFCGAYHYYKPGTNSTEQAERSCKPPRTGRFGNIMTGGEYGDLECKR